MSASPLTRRGRAVLLAVVAVSGCAVADARGPRDQQAADDVAGPVTVLAAASLTDAFEVIASSFEAVHPGVDVVLGFGGSGSLAQQVLAGAPADVLVTASPETMDQVVSAGRSMGEPAVFAANHLEVAVPAGNPGGVRDLADFADPDRTLALCAAEVPCGVAARRVFAAAGVVPRPDTLERDARAALAKVRLGEVDAALVYRTDVLAARGDVEGVPLPTSPAGTTEYLVTAVRGSGNRSAARAFVDFVVGTSAREVLDDAGFVSP